MKQDLVRMSEAEIEEGEVLDNVASAFWKGMH